jgi:hypothetical protein
MVIDLTAQLAPVGIAMLVVLFVSGVGIVACVDRQEASPLGRWFRAASAALQVSRSSAQRLTAVYRRAIADSDPLRCRLQRHNSTTRS